MNIIINISNNLGGGGLQVALSVLKELKNINEHTYYVFLGVNAAKQICKETFPSNFTFYDIPKVKFWQLHKVLKPLEKQIKADVVFTVFGPSYWKPKSPHLMGFAYPHYVYGEYAFLKHIPRLQKIKLKLKQWIHLYLFKHQADHIVVETEDVQKRLKKKLRVETVSVVSNTCGSQYLNPTTYPNKLPNRKNQEVRLITITKYYPHKNLESIPLVLQELYMRNINNITFVLTLEKEEYEKIIPSEWHSRVYNVGPVPVEKCPSLYQECDLLYLPTLLECFSASYPEAMVMQKPILTSDLSFAHSICESAALYFDPFSVKDISDKIESIINEQDLQNELIIEGRKRFVAFGSARDRAEKYLQLCKELTFKENLK